MRLLYAKGARVGDYRRRHGWRGVWWLARRRPSHLYQMAGAGIVERLSGWSASHVMVDDGQAVLDYGFAVTRFWPSLAVAQYPGLIAVQRVYVMSQPNLTEFEGRQDAGWAWLVCVTVAYWILWLTRGRVRLFTDCVTAAKRCLGHVGIEVPPSVWTPSQLRDWLENHGHPYTSLEHAASIEP